MLGLLLLIGLACWCWFSTGPLFLRWPLVVLIVLIILGLIVYSISSRPPSGAKIRIPHIGVSAPAEESTP